ncbi:MAG: DUF3089 domain-containing protein [Flavobacteriaceae bacterium]
MKRILCLLLIQMLVSCKTVYNTEDFNEGSVPAPPDYSKSKYWAVKPDLWPDALREIVGDPSEKKADVFFIYPTLFSDKRDSRWNADINNQLIRDQVIDQAVAFQSSAWTAAANLYVPFYRQAHYRIFVDPYAQQGKQAGVLAYQDVKKAFQYFLDYQNQGRPIIIASHSQGSLHAKRLIKEFFDGKELQNRLIAAYLVGAKIMPNEFKNIVPLNQPDATGGFVSWNTYKLNKLPKKYDEWYKDGVVTKPVTLTDEENSLIINQLGVLSSDGKIYPKSISVKKTNGMLWSTVPKIPKRFFLSFIKNYHFADINLFWVDIQQNALLRTEAWFQKNKSESK